MHPRIYSGGERFGRLVITEPYHEKRGKVWYHKCACDCGNERMAAGGDMKQGKVTSCGCLRKEMKTSHGMTKEPEYAVWNAMLQRCEKENYALYKNYGGRGIKVCERWHKFANFIADMGRRPSDDHTLERVDNDGDYEPGNCRWDTRAAQSLNQRVRRDNKTGCRGVSLDSSSGYYQANINVEGKRVYLGRFSDIDSAVSARKKAEAKYHNRKGANHG